MGNPWYFRGSKNRWFQRGGTGRGELGEGKNPPTTNPVTVNGLETLKKSRDGWMYPNVPLTMGNPDFWPYSYVGIYGLWFVRIPRKCNAWTSFHVLSVLCTSVRRQSLLQHLGISVVATCGEDQVPYVSGHMWWGPSTPSPPLMWNPHSDLQTPLVVWVHLVVGWWLSPTTSNESFFTPGHIVRE